MIINDLFNNKKTAVAEGIEGSVVFSGTGDNGSKYEIIQSGDDFMIHANGRHIDSYGSLQRAMSVLRNEVPGLQQGVAEGSDPEKKQRLKDLIDQYRDATDPEAHYGLDAELVIAQIRKEFGDRTADSVEQGPSMHYPRPGHSMGYDPMQYKSSPRITKSGVLNKQDVGSMKRDIKQRLKQDMAEVKVPLDQEPDWVKSIRATAAKMSKPGSDRPYTPPAADPADLEKRQRDLTARYPNIDELVRKAELNRDPNYEYANGEAYYSGREAEQNYLKLKQIQRVIQGLNESQADSKKKELSTGTGRVNPDTGRPWTPSELKAKYANVDFDKDVRTAELKRLSDIAKQEKLKDKIKASLDDPRDSTRDLAKSFINKGGLGMDFKPPAPTPVPPTPSSAPVTVQGQPPGFTYSNLAQQPSMAQYMQSKSPAAPKPAPSFAQGPTGYKTTTTNVPSVAATTTTPPAGKNTSDILQALTKMGFKSKEAEAAIKRLPPNISTNDALLQILRGKQMSESLAWSKNFDPGRSLYHRMKQDL